MIKGFKKQLAVGAPALELGASILFVLSGELKINGSAVSENHGYACFNNDNAILEASAVGAECLIIDLFEKRGAFLRAAGVGVNGGEFVLASDKLQTVEKLANCFFSGVEAVVYDDLHFERGIYEILLSLISSGASATENSHDIVHLTEEYIEKNLENPIKIDAIAAELSISRGYLRNIFFAAHGISPQEYLIARRIERACELLLTTDIPISAIAAAVGYDDPLGFSRIFRKKVGASPRAYRESRKNATEKPGPSAVAPVAPVAPAPSPEPEAGSSSEPSDLTAELAAEIERAAAAARQKEEEARKNVAPPPFWLL